MIYLGSNLYVPSLDDQQDLSHNHWLNKIDLEHRWGWSLAGMMQRFFHDICCPGGTVVPFNGIAPVAQEDYKILCAAQSEHFWASLRSIERMRKAKQLKEFFDDALANHKITRNEYLVLVYGDADCFPRDNRTPDNSPLLQLIDEFVYLKRRYEAYYDLIEDHLKNFAVYRATPLPDDWSSLRGCWIKKPTSVEMGGKTS